MASDELCRYGLNFHQREQLISAVAHIIIEYFAQLKQLEQLLPKTNAEPANV